MKRYIRSSDDADFGYGYDSNGGVISESTVDEMYRIAGEVLEQSNLAQLDPYTTIDEDSFEYFSSGTAWGAYLKYEIDFDAFSDKIDINSFVDWDEVEDQKLLAVDTKSGRYEIVVRFGIFVDGSTIDAEVGDVLVKDGNRFDDYLAKVYMQILDSDRFCEYIKNLAEPVVDEIQSTLSNI